MRTRLGLGLVPMIGWLLATSAGAAELGPPTEGDFIMKDFAFADGERLAELRIHYRTFGKIHRTHGHVDNAVLVMHGTGGEGGSLVRPEFSGVLFAPGGLLDAQRYFIVLPDGIGHGKSSKPSDGSRAKFPHYGYRDMVAAEHRLITDGLKIDHLRLVMGTSMGGMHTWLWGETYPTAMDALMPLASLPTQISGRNRVWRRMIIDAIRTDPTYDGGNYTAQPPGLRIAEEVFFFMSSNSVLRQAQMPTRAEADAVLDRTVGKMTMGADGNDTIYQLAASEDYDPGPGLEKIAAPLLAINSADDLINPPELGVLEREIKRVPHGRAVVLPLSPETQGHGTHTMAAVWKNYLAELLAATSR